MRKKSKSWIDLVLNRQLQPAAPEQSREHLATHPLTHDRRRIQAAAKGPAEPGPADAAPEASKADAGADSATSLMYQNQGGARTSGQLRQAIQDSAADVQVERDEFRGDEPAEDHSRQAPRRSSKRVLAPVCFQYFVEPDQLVHMELTVLLFEGKRPRALNCYLYDASDQGMAFACPEQLQVGDMVSVCAHLSEDMDPLVDTTVEIRNVRPMQDDCEKPERFGDLPLWIHGALLEQEQALILLKATLDCVTLQYATGGVLQL